MNVLFFACLLGGFLITTKAEQTTEEAANDLVNTAIEECRALTKVSNETRQKLRSRIFTDIPQAKEYLYCVFRTIGWVDEEGKVDKELAKGFFENHPKRLEAMLKCLDIVGEDKEDTAFQAYKCYMEKLPKDVKAFGKDEETTESEEDGSEEKVFN